MCYECWSCLFTFSALEIQTTTRKKQNSGSPEKGFSNSRPGASIRQILNDKSQAGAKYDSSAVDCLRDSAAVNISLSQSIAAFVDRGSLLCANRNSELSLTSIWNPVPEFSPSFCPPFCMISAKRISSRLLVIC